MTTKPFEDLLQKQVETRFADLKGSWANLHLEIPESLLNDAMQAALASQVSPWLSLVEGASVKGNVSVEVKLKA